MIELVIKEINGWVYQLCSQIKKQSEGIYCDIFEDFGLDIWHQANHDKLAATTAPYVPRL